MGNETSTPVSSGAASGGMVATTSASASSVSHQAANAPASELNPYAAAASSVGIPLSHPSHPAFIHAALKLGMGATQLFMESINDRDLRAVLQYLGVPCDDCGTYAALRDRLQSAIGSVEPFKLPNVGDTRIDLSKGVIGMEWFLNATKGGVAGAGVAPQFGEGAGLSAPEERDLLRRLPLPVLIAIVAARAPDPIAVLDAGKGVSASGVDREYLVEVAARCASRKSASHLLEQGGINVQEATDEETRRARVSAWREAQMACTVCGECKRELKPHWAPNWSDGMFCECELNDAVVRRVGTVDNDVKVWDDTLTSVNAGAADEGESEPRKDADAGEYEPRWYAPTPADASARETAAAAAALERADAPLIESMTCPACSELFSEPVILSCSHRLCLRCAQHFAQNIPIAPEDMPKVGEERDIATLHCPVCDVASGIGMAGLSSLKKDKLLHNTVERYLLRYRAAQRGLSILAPEATWESGVTCEICSERDASVQCDQCRVNYCVPCRAMAHPNKGKLASHTFTPLRPEAALNNAISRYCQFHPEHRLTLFDTATGTAVCTQCTESTHKGHETRPLRETYEECVAKVSAKHDELKKSERLCQERMEAYADAAATLRDEGQRLRVGIEHSFAALRASLGRQERALVEAVRHRENAARLSLREAHVQVKGTHETLRRANAFCEGVLEEPDAADFTAGADRLLVDLAAVSTATQKEVDMAAKKDVDVSEMLNLAKEARAVHASLADAVSSWDVLGGSTAADLAKRLKERAMLAEEK